MPRGSEKPEQPAFDPRDYMPLSPLPPLMGPQHVVETPAPEMPVSSMFDIGNAPRSTAQIPASPDSVYAWQEQERRRRQQQEQLRRPSNSSTISGLPPGFFVPAAIAQRQERHALTSAPATVSSPSTSGNYRLTPPVPSKGLPAGPSGKGSKELSAPRKDSRATPQLGEFIRKHKKASGAIAAGAALLIAYGANHSGNNLSGGDATAAAMEAEYPTVRNEAINCAAPAFTMAFSGNTTARLPVTLKEAGHTETYLEFDVSGLASTVANICAVRQNNAGQVLATYDGDNDRYSFDRSKIQLSTSEALTNTNNINIVFTGEYVDAKPLTQADVKKYPFDDATNTRLVDLLAVKQDPKTKANVLTPTPQLSRIIRLKMEQLGLAVLQNPDTCANTQVAADQAVNNYVKGQLSRRTPATSKARQVTISGNANYGALTTAFRANKDTAAALDSKLVTLGDLTLNSCDAAPPQATAAPTPTSKKG